MKISSPVIVLAAVAVTGSLAVAVYLAHVKEQWRQYDAYKEKRKARPNPYRKTNDVPDRDLWEVDFGGWRMAYADPELAYASKIGWEAHNPGETATVLLNGQTPPA